MGDSLWDLDDTAAGEQRVLSRKEREFLMSGEPGTYTTAEMERRVSAKVEKFPDRVQQLIDDVALLFYRDHLGSEASPAIWEQMLSISGRSQTVRDSPVVRTARYQTGAAGDLGFEVGSLMRMIHGEASSPDFIWGLIIGLFGESDGEWEKEAGNLVELFAELEEQYEWRLFSAGAEAHQVDGLQEERQEVIEILGQHGFAPAPPLVDAIIIEYTSDESGGKIDRPKKSWEADPDEIDHPQPPDERALDREMRRTHLDRIVARFDEQTQLRSIDRLAKDLREDSIRIQKRQWRGVDPDQAFRFIARHGETQIQEFEQTQTKGQNNMTTALRRLSYEDSNWVNRPVLRRHTGESAYWELTYYGTLLSEVRIEKNGRTDWLFDYVVKPENIEGRLKQLIDESLELS